MTRRQIIKRIDALLDEYGWASTWPESYQEEYERLCAMLYEKR